MNDVDNREKDLEMPRIVVCDLDGQDWLKIKDDTILVDYQYVRKIERNHQD